MQLHSNTSWLQLRSCLGVLEYESESELTSSYWQDTYVLTLTVTYLLRFKRSCCCIFPSPIQWQTASSTDMSLSGQYGTCVNLWMFVGCQYYDHSQSETVKVKWQWKYAVCSMQQQKFTITDGNSNWKAVPHTSWTDYLQLPHHRWIWWCCTTHDGWVLSCSDKTTFAFAAFPFDDASVGPLASRNGHPMVKNRFNSWSCHSKQSCGRYQDVNLRVGAPPFESVNKHSQRWRAFFAAGCSHETGVRSTTSAMSFSKQSLCSPRCHQSYNDNTDNTRLD